MAPSRRKGSGRAAAAAAARQRWKVGDLVLAKMKGFPAWPAMVSEPEKWGYSSDRKKLLVYFYGTKQIAFCNHVDVEAFTEEKKKSLLIKRQGKGADFVRAVEEIIDSYEKLKRQSHDEFNSGDEGIISNPGDFDGSRIKSRKSEEHISQLIGNHQSEALCTSIENGDVLNAEEIPLASKEGNICKMNTVAKEPSEEVSILDQLRQTSLAASISGKRRRDAPLQTFATQRRVPSLRRSRSSSSVDPCKFQKSTMQLVDAEKTGGDFIPDLVQDESAVSNMPIGNVPQLSVCHDVDLLPCVGLVSYNSSEDIGYEMAAMKSTTIHLSEASMLESGGKHDNSRNGYLEKDVLSNGKLDIPMKTMILKKKRKPNRKRVTNSTECARLDKEPELVEMSGNFSESPKSHKEIKERHHKADGDEHLPLVKRARVRMGKPPVEESQLDEFVGTQPEKEVLVSRHDKSAISSSPGDICPPDRTSLGVREVLTCSSPLNDCPPSAGSDVIFWKAKYQLKGSTLDVEAALPPSKRLHRALEAMSANAAEARNDCPEVPRVMDMIPNGDVDSPKVSSLCLSSDRNGGSPTGSQDVQSSDGHAFLNSASRLTSSLASQNLEVPTSTSSDVKPDDTLTISFGSPLNKYSKGIHSDVKDCNGPSISKYPDAEIHVKSLQPCSEKKINVTSRCGMLDQLSSPVGEANENHILQPTKKCADSLVDETVGEDGTMEAILQKPLDSLLDFKEAGDSFSLNGAGAFLSVIDVASSANIISESTKSSSSESDDNMQELVKEVKHKATSKDMGFSPDLTPMKVLIAAAQAKRFLSRSTSFTDNIADRKVLSDANVSTSLVHRDDSSEQVPSPNPMIYRTPGSDDRTHLHNGNRSPNVILRQKGLTKFSGHVEANTARKSFETMLCTLSRAKDSIGRATRLAIDCAKYGIAGEVVEVLLQNLEKESSLSRRVDLFFLVDSITQCSRSQKGGAGDVYPSLVLSVLPRLLCAAAPPGNAAWENRRQCLKVLRLWLERKILPESIVRHHMRELDSMNEVSYTSDFSRRPSRTERAINDPIREMEGMLVDEYGSNTSFRIPDLLYRNVLEDEEEGSPTSEKSFEAVTPEHNAEDDDEKGATVTSTAEKHRHILEDVDGELEMEDVAPPCEVEVRSTCHAARVDAVCNSQHQFDQCHSLPFLPPLPEDMPPSPPPLPSSPPPMAPPGSPPLSLVPQQPSAGSHALADVANSHHFRATYNVENRLPLSACQQPSNLTGNLMSSESIPHHTPGYGGLPKQMAPPVSALSSSGSYGNLPSSHLAMHSGNMVQPLVSVPSPNRAYHLQPPPPIVSNQFSYIQGEPQQRVQSWGDCSSSFNKRFQFVYDMQGGNNYGDIGTRGQIQHEIAERGRFSPAVYPGPVLSEKVEASPTSLSFVPLSEPSPIPCHGWSRPPRASSYHSLPSSRPALENPISRVSGASGYWRPR